MNRKKYIDFVRFGDINLIKQKGYTTDSDKMGYHTPPSRYGIYAFPEYSVYEFLIGGDYTVNKAPKLDIDLDELEYDDGYRCLIPKHRKLIKKCISKKGIRLKRVNSYWKRQCGDNVCEDCQLDCDNIPVTKFIYGHKNPKKFSYRKPLWHHLDVPECNVIDRHGEWVYTDYKVWMESYLKMINSERNHYYKTRIKYSKDHHEVFIDCKI